MGRINGRISSLRMTDVDASRSVALSHITLLKFLNDARHLQHHRSLIRHYPAPIDQKYIQPLGTTLKMRPKWPLLQPPGFPHQSFYTIALHGLPELTGRCTETDLHSTLRMWCQQGEGTNLAYGYTLARCEQGRNGLPALQSLRSLQCECSGQIL